MGGPNCGHYPTAYFGDKRGNELKKISLEEATAQYELSQKQRYLERGIRKWKRRERIFEDAEDKEYAKKCKDKVKEWQLRARKFTEDNNLKRKFSRENVEKNSTAYRDITLKYTSDKEYVLKEQQYFIDEEGNKYNIDGKNVKIKSNEKERQVAEILGKVYGGQVSLVPVVLNPKGIKTPDYLVNGKKFDLKEPRGCSKTTIYDLFKHKSKQADNFVIDISKSGLDRKESLEQSKKIFYSKHRKWVNTIMLMDNNEVFKILVRR